MINNEQDQKQQDVGANIKDQVSDKEANSLEKLELLSSPTEKQKDKTLTVGKGFEDSITQELILDIRSYIDSYINLADTKAAFLLGIFTGFIIALFNKNGLLLGQDSNIYWLKTITLYISYISLVFGIIFSVFVVWPRLSSKNKKGLFSWVHVDKYHSSEEYQDELIKSSKNTIISDLIELNFSLSKICSKKYFWLSYAFRLGAIGIIFGFFLLIL